MKREDLISELGNYKTQFDEERLFIPIFIDLLENQENCFERSLVSGHITGSAWVLNESFTKALFVHHVKLNRWLQPGGHADGDENIHHVAMKELREETGVVTVKPYTTTIFDLDVHKIPVNRKVPEHNHFDIRYLFVVSDKAKLTVSKESKEVKWWHLMDVPKIVDNEHSIMRMVAKSNLLN